jgi:bifunctional non-homologous end joining protein LigD
MVNPDSIQPTAPIRVPVPVHDRAYVHELKWDGFRGVVCVGDGAQGVYSKNRHRFTRFDPLVAAIASALSGRSAILDGEIVCVDANGRPDFAALMSRRGMPVYAAFDLLALDGQDLRALPLLERKRRLRRLIRHDGPELRYAPHVRCDGADFFQAACALDLEGIVSKPADSPYVSQPSPWRKTLNPAYGQKTEARGELFTRRS